MGNILKRPSTRISKIPESSPHFTRVSRKKAIAFHGLEPLLNFNYHKVSLNFLQKPTPTLNFSDFPRPPAGLHPVPRGLRSRARLSGAPELRSWGCRAGSRRSNRRTWAPQPLQSPPQNVATTLNGMSWKDPSFHLIGLSIKARKLYYIYICDNYMYNISKYVLIWHYVCLIIICRSWW